MESQTGLVQVHRPGVAGQEGRLSDTRVQGVRPQALAAGFQARLRLFPVPLFALVMGLAGFAIAWQRAEAVLGLPFSVSPALSFLAVGAFALIAALYLLKLAIHPAEVAKEFRHPVRVNFFPTMSIAMVLLATLLYEPAPALARWLWTAGAALHFVFTLYVMNAWIHRTGVELGHVNPAWFIPVVGNVLLPVTRTGAGADRLPLRPGLEKTCPLAFRRRAQPVGRAARAS